MSIARRAEFDAIATGWGTDALLDLHARLELLAEFWRENFPLNPAEHKMARAMITRLHTLGGTAPVTFQ